MKNLSIFNHFVHFNILKLLTLYTYDEKQNLVFFLTERGTLHDFFKNKFESSSFKSEKAFYIALAKFSSAIQHVYNFVEKKINLSLIDCHHDLQFKNIFVFKNTFILTDLNLSKFKNSFESSKTSVKKKKMIILHLNTGTHYKNLKNKTYVNRAISDCLNVY